jgi:hypothetical protein
MMGSSRFCPRCEMEWNYREMDSGIARSICSDCFQAPKTTPQPLRRSAEAKAAPATKSGRID